MLVTGHTGFKGSWISHWLHRLGAEVHGLALDPLPGSHFERADTSALLASDQRVDLRDGAALERAVHRAEPEVVLHLAAQALVRPGYDDPVGTLATNVMGTVHLLQACRGTRTVNTVLSVTSDKCYRHEGGTRPFREADPLGGHDPYSASKAATEIVTEAWARSFLQPQGVAVATARAGNVIGGGDHAVDRLLPDLFRALAAGQALHLRQPQAVRPWQHVLDALSGYLVLSQALAQGQTGMARAYNFAPPGDEIWSVAQVVDHMACVWDEPIRVRLDPPDGSRPEATLLRLDASQARSDLGWQARLTVRDAVAWTAQWERAVRRGESARLHTMRQIGQWMEGGEHHGS